MTNYLWKLGFLLFLIVLSACAQIFYSPDAYTLASAQKIIAIIPPSISIQASKHIDGDALKNEEETEALSFQNQIYAWFLQRKGQGHIVQELQQIETTNALLKKAGYPETPLTTSDLCSILSVDGIITSHFSLSKPMSEGSAVALNILFGTTGMTNQVQASLSITDCKNTKMIFNYNGKLQGSVGSTPENLIDGMMRQSSKKMPYYQK